MAFRRWLVVLALTTLTVNRPLAESPHEATVSGRVVVGAADAPGRQAIVVVWGDKTRTLRAMVADDNGGFSFNDLPDDSYRVGASLRPHLATHIAATSGENVVRLTPGAAISGTVTDVFGAPVAEVAVEARSATGGAGTATTDTRGNYRIFALPVGDYTVHTDRATPLTVTVAAGDDRQGVNLTMAAAPDVTPISSGPSSIAGTVVDRDNGEGLAGVIVGLGGPGARQTMTDNLGAFVFRDLAPDTYTLEVTDGRYRRIGSAVIAPSESAITDVQLRAARLGAVSGRLITEWGGPAVGTLVMAFHRTEISLRPIMTPVGQATTDDQGQYAIGRLPDGDYLICACGQASAAWDPSLVAAITGGRASTEQVAAVAATLPVNVPSFHPGRGTTSNAVVVTVEPGDERMGIDITVARAVARRVTGRITATDTRILPRTTMRLVSKGDIAEAVALTEIEPATISDRGEFEFALVPEGEYTLAAFSMEDGAPQFAIQDVSVGAADVTGLTVTMNAGAEVRGRVQLPGGLVPEFAANEVPRISLVPVSLSFPALITAGITGAVGIAENIDKDGTFVLAGLPADRYVIVPHGFPSPWRTVTSVTGAGTQGGDAILTVPSGGSVSLTITLGEEEAATMSGTVELDPFESPQGARVVLFPADRRQWTELYRAPGRVLAVPVNARFRYEFGDIPPGDYIAVVVRSGELQYTQRNLERWAKRGELVTLSSGETAQRVLSGR